MIDITRKHAKKSSFQYFYSPPLFIKEKKFFGSVTYYAKNMFPLKISKI